MNKKISEAILFYYYLKPFGINRLPKGISNISVFASPRGGSTWVAQTIQELTNASLVWEPLFKHPKYKINTLNPFAYPERHKCDISWNQYIPYDASWNEAHDFFEKLFSKEILNLKLLRFNDFSSIKQSNFFLYKFCFGNNLLPWLVENFEIQPTLVVRHPCAVVASQLNYGAWDWHKNNLKFDYNMTTFPEFYVKYREILDSIKNVEEKLAANWAMTVLTPVKHINNDVKWVTLAYEDLLQNPDEALLKIKKRYNLSWDDNKMRDIVQKQSFTKSSFNNEKSNKLNSWKNHLTSSQINNILKFIERMGVDFYSENLEPDYSIIYK